MRQHSHRRPYRGTKSSLRTPKRLQIGGRDRIGFEIEIYTYQHLSDEDACKQKHTYQLVVTVE